MNIDLSKEKHKLHEAAMTYWVGAFDEKFDDTKRHYEMLKTALPIVELIKPANILTIGDNRGRDAAYFKNKIGCHVTASDLDISKIEPAKNDGYIDDFKIIDVEKIQLPDNSVDLIIVKESFHHWPRPMLGFYEVLRVARMGVILIEPYDSFCGEKVNPYINKNDYSDQYEEVGNFLYRISLREILKSAWSLYMNRVVTFGFNDPYSADFTYEKWMDEKKYLDELGKSGKRQFNLMTIFVEKIRLNFEYENELKEYTTYIRPLNKHMEI
jgi:SAM-dependent methyltransferase